MRGSDRFVSRKLKSFDRTLYWEHEGNQAARRGRWKLVPKYPGQHKLYDIEADRTELRDRAGNQPNFGGAQEFLEHLGQRLPAFCRGSRSKSLFTSAAPR